MQAPFQNKPYKKNKKTESGRKARSRLSLGCDDKMDTCYKCEHKTITKRKAPNAACASRLSTGAGGRTRTGTVSLPVDFESTTSANSITPAGIWKSRYYYTVSSPKLQPLFQKKFIFSLPISTFHKLASKAPTHYNCWPRDLLILRSTTESNHP